MLAEALDADFLLVLTDVPHVLRDFGTPEQTPVRRATPGGLRALDSRPARWAPRSTPPAGSSS